MEDRRDLRVSRSEFSCATVNLTISGEKLKRVGKADTGTRVSRVDRAGQSSRIARNSGPSNGTRRKSFRFSILNSVFVASNFAARLFELSRPI